MQGVGCLFFCGEMLVSFLVEVNLFMCVHVCIHICIYICVYILYGIMRYRIIYAHIYISCILHKHTQIHNLYVTETFFLCVRVYI